VRAVKKSQSMRWQVQWRQRGESCQKHQKVGLLSGIGTEIHGRQGGRVRLAEKQVGHSLWRDSVAMAAISVVGTNFEVEIIQSGAVRGLFFFLF